MCVKHEEQLSCSEVEVDGTASDGNGAVLQELRSTRE